MIRIVVREQIKNGSKEQVLGLFREMVEATRKEEGNLMFTLNEAVDDPNTLSIIEAWEDERFIDAHRESEHSKRLLPQLGQHLAAPSRVEIYKELL